MSIKMLIMLERQQFNNSENEEMAPIIYKHQQFDEYDDKKR